MRKKKKNILPYMDKRQKDDEREEKNIMPVIWTKFIEFLQS